MSIITYRTPEFTTWPGFGRWNAAKDLLDAAFQLTSNGGNRGWAPALDIFENEDAVTVRLEVAGVKKEDFDISLHDDVLTISGERKSPESEQSESFRSERHFGSFRRSVTLPVRVKSESVSANYQDGILTVTLPKAEEAKPRKIQVNLN